ncbi:MAG: hypothetical protein GY938_28835 [Ketobacter sp.]|nr:hypothetical protein [Ketobacter sp.]
MSEATAADILSRIKPLLNKRVGPYNSWNPVSRTHIWQWCSAMGDSNPLYQDDAYRAQHSEFSGEKAVAPPTMMQMWSMRDVNGNDGPGSTTDNLYEILTALEQEGYEGIMAVSYDQTFHRYLEEGDSAHHYSTIVDISDLKTTGMGKGFFVTQWAEFLDQNEELFAEAKITYFKYQTPKQQPGAKQASAPGKINRIHPVENHDHEHFWQGLRDGKLLIQKCDDCGELRHPPQPMCEHCQSIRWSTIESKGKGTVYTYTVMHYPEIPPFDYPNAIVLVDLEEGVRIVSQLIGTKPNDIHIGMAVEMKLTEVQEGMTLPLFHAVDKA